MSNLRLSSGFTVYYVSNESERSFPQHSILSSTTLHCRSLPLRGTVVSRRCHSLNVQSLYISKTDPLKQNKFKTKKRIPDYPYYLSE